MAKWQRMWDGQDNQEVGLEAAILERKRNSSLVEQLSCAEDVAGLKPCTEAAGVRGQMTDDRGQTRTDRRLRLTLEDLEVFKRAYRLSLEVHRAVWTSRRSSSGRWRIRSAAPASRSAPTWPKASAGRACAGRLQPLLMMAMGSADEMRLWCRYCLDLGYIDEATWQTLAPGVSRDREDAAGSADVRLA